MRLKKVKNAINKIESSNYFIKDPIKHKGQFKKIFNNTNPIYLEIGVGKGDFLIENAIQNPNINFLGIEKYDSVLLRAIEKIDTLNLNNIYFLNEDAGDIDKIFDREIDLIYLNFSDPWPKKRHYKRRLTSEQFLKKYDLIFKEKSKIIQKTDNRNLFEFSLISYVNQNYKIKNISLDLHKSEIVGNIVTEYEQKFSSQGFPIYMVDVEK